MIEGWINLEVEGWNVRSLILSLSLSCLCTTKQKMIEIYWWELTNCGKRGFDQTKNHLHIDNLHSPTTTYTHTSQMFQLIFLVYNIHLWYIFVCVNAFQKRNTSVYMFSTTTLVWLSSCMTSPSRNLVTIDIVHPCPTNLTSHYCTQEKYRNLLYASSLFKLSNKIGLWTRKGNSSTIVLKSHPIILRVWTKNYKTL